MANNNSLDRSRQAVMIGLHGDDAAHHFIPARPDAISLVGSVNLCVIWLKEMKTLGIIAVVLGVAICLLGIGNIDFIGGMGVMRALGLGFTCCAVGAICIVTGSITRQLDDIHSKIDRISKLVSSKETAEHIVDQLRQEGMINPGSDAATDLEIDAFLN